MIGRQAFRPRPTFVKDLDELLCDVDTPLVAPAVIEPLGELLGGVMVEHIHIEFALFGEAGEREIAGAKKACNGIVRVRAEAKVELGVERVPEMELHDHLARLELRREPAQARLVIVGWGSNRELRTELLGQPALQADDRLIAHLVLMWQEAVGFAQLLLRQPLHAHKKAALLARAARPLIHKVVDRLPTAQVEVADAEIGAVGDFERRPQRRKQVDLNIVEDAGHQAPGSPWRTNGPEPVVALGISFNPGILSTQLVQAPQRSAKPAGDGA